MKKQNIIFIFSDQQRWDTLGCYNDSINFTPNLDRLAETGVKFSNAYTCQPVCGPARACLQTGLYATQLNCFRNGIALPKEAVTIADRFNENGYQTAYIGKWHLASTDGAENFRTEAVPADRRSGYKDYWMAADVLEFTSNGFGGYMYDGDCNKVNFEGYRADCHTDFVLDYLSNRNSDKPHFLFISYIEPHHQNNAGHFQGPLGSKEKFKDYPIPGDLAPFDGDWREEYPDYLGCCESLDKNVGRIIDKLKELGEYDNTTIIYTSDHGSHFRTRNGEYKRSCHDSCIHIPLIISGGGFSGGKTNENMVSLIDLPTTLLAEAGINPTAGMQGQPLQDVVSGTLANPSEDIFLQISESQVGRAIRTKRWKYSVSAPSLNGAEHSFSPVYEEEFLYDLANDPFELTNLVNSPLHKSICEELKERLIKRMVAARESVPEIKPCSKQ